MRTPTPSSPAIFFPTPRQTQSKSHQRWHIVFAIGAVFFRRSRLFFREAAFFSGGEGCEWRAPRATVGASGDKAENEFSGFIPLPVPRKGFSPHIPASRLFVLFHPTNPTNPTNPRISPIHPIPNPHFEKSRISYFPCPYPVLVFVLVLVFAHFSYLCWKFFKTENKYIQI